MNVTQLFNSITVNDYMHFYDDGKFNPKKVVTGLKFKAEQVAIATKLPKASIRYDEKMSNELRIKIEEWATVINLVADFFQDTKKTILWFNTRNPQLANLKPTDMILSRRVKKLQAFIHYALYLNNRD